MTYEIADLNLLLELKPYKAAEICDRLLDARRLVDLVESWQPFTRKSLCEYLGIGESTLSGWLKEGRIPQMAKNAIVLLLAHQQLAEEVKALRLEKKRAQTDLKVVRSGERFQVCEFIEDEEGEVIGRVIADHVDTLEDARLLASGRRTLQLAADTTFIFDYVREQSENEAFLEQIEALQAQLVAQALFVTDHQQWKKSFGKKGRGERAKELLGKFAAMGMEKLDEHDHDSSK